MRTSNYTTWGSYRKEGSCQRQLVGLPRALRGIGNRESGRTPAE